MILLHAYVLAYGFKCSIAVIHRGMLCGHSQSNCRVRPANSRIMCWAVDVQQAIASCLHIHVAAFFAITGATAATFLRHLTVEYGPPAGEAFIAVARSHAFGRWGTVYHKYIVSVHLGT